MKYKLACADIVDAVQWRGDNIAEVQKLLAPDSPLMGGGHQHFGFYNGTNLTFVDRNQWLLKTEVEGKEPSFVIMKDDEFQRQFAPIVTPTPTSHLPFTIDHAKWGDAPYPYYCFECSLRTVFQKESGPFFTEEPLRSLEHAQEHAALHIQVGGYPNNLFLAEMESLGLKF